jgi:hypothetical protein
MGCDVWEASAGKVDVRAVILFRFFANVRVQVEFNRGILVPGTFEIIAETAG